VVAPRFHGDFPWNRGAVLYGAPISLREDRALGATDGQMNPHTKNPPKRSKPPKPRKAPERSMGARSPCPVVGIGASAGGLEAFSLLLRQLPVRTGFGFVLVQHLDPQHESALANILAKTTAMPVCEVTNNLRVRADHVYIIPPNSTLSIVKGVLKLLPRQRNRLAPRSIDFFFESLARDKGERSIGVILSGNATDGTLGLEAIKEAGGLTFAQDHSARYESMPRSAVAAGCVDLVMSPAKIAVELARIAKHPYLSAGASRPASTGGAAARSRGLDSVDDPLSQTRAIRAGALEKSGFDEILLLLRNHTGVDFSLYKPSTISRRIARRSVLNRRSGLKSYADFLRGNTKELDALYADTLINVTSFFRNAEAYAALKRVVFSKLLAEGGDEPVRVWVLGCSTGQEAYSIAMAFMESAEKVPRARKLQIFATDLSEASLDRARHGSYPKTLAQDVSSERLRRFFIEDENGYQVSKQLRESVVFARQNVISDPPFSRMDVISCRNVMIYLEASLQRKVIPMFHYALKKGGFLFLGASESIGGFGELFAPANKKQKIFVRKAAHARTFQLPVRSEAGARTARPRALLPSVLAANRPGGAKAALISELNAEREADRVTVNHFAPPGVLINADFQVLQFRGRTGSYLESPTGKATFDILRMAREGLMLPLRAAINSASRENRTSRRENIQLKSNGRTRSVNVEVVPLRNLKDKCYLVLFEEARAGDAEGAGNGDSMVPVSGARAGQRSAKAEDSFRIAGLERDLSESRDYLQSVQEHQEAANEELQSANEEGQSANEELQSLNEELETSKEELESTNEELTTVNEEMVSRNTELNHLIEDRKRNEEALRASDARFRALFDLGPVGVYSCDTSGRIVEFNRCAASLWGRSPKTGERGDRFCGSSRMRTPVGALLRRSRCPMAAVLSGKIPAARDVEVVIVRPDRSEVTVVVNIVPLKNSLGETAGAINCFYDVSERKRSEVALREAQLQLSKHVGKLEILVGARTAKLVEANARLVTSIEDTRRGKEEYQALFGESLVMQEKLRHLTRLIISAQEQERRKISRELHDEVVQTLIGINIELTSLKKGGVIGGVDLRVKVAAIQQMVEKSVNAVHRFARGLRPAVLDDLGLIPALHGICKSLKAKKKLNIQMTAFRGVEDLNGAGRTVLFRIAQEALSNIGRHANASEVRLSVAKVGNTVRMEVSDNGRSFQAEKMLSEKNPKRLGLIGMRERLEMIGGTLAIESSRGKGTLVRAEIPFTASDEPNESN
jgi:chemotaxis methyl-accepting protein methylase/signal transduction histidine kinase